MFSSFLQQLSIIFLRENRMWLSSCPRSMIFFLFLLFNSLAQSISRMRHLKQLLVLRLWLDLLLLLRNKLLLLWNNKLLLLLLQPTRHLLVNPLEVSDLIIAQVCEVLPPNFVFRFIKFLCCSPIGKPAKSLNSQDRQNCIPAICRVFAPAAKGKNRQRKSDDEHEGRGGQELEVGVVGGAFLLGEEFFVLLEDDAALLVALLCG